MVPCVFLPLKQNVYKLQEYDVALTEPLINPI
jgi:hypothetical protein